MLYAHLRDLQEPQVAQDSKLRAKVVSTRQGQPTKERQFKMPCHSSGCTTCVYRFEYNPADGSQLGLRCCVAHLRLGVPDRE